MQFCDEYPAVQAQPTMIQPSLCRSSEVVTVGQHALKIAQEPACVISPEKPYILYVTAVDRPTVGLAPATPPYPWGKIKNPRRDFSFLQGPFFALSGGIN